MASACDLLTTNESEEWRPVEGYPNYKVSNIGNVRIERPRNATISANRLAKASMQSKDKLDDLLMIKKPVKQQLNNKGYLVCMLADDTKKQYLRKVARIVAIAFVDGRNVNGRNCVDHINGIRTDNRSSNLRWVTASENSQNRGLSKTGLPSGISFDKQKCKYYVNVSINNHEVETSGSFDCFEKALSFRNETKMKLHGEFARIITISEIDLDKIPKATPFKSKV